MGRRHGHLFVPNVHSTGHIIPALHASASPLRTTHLRDPNGPAGTFAGESFMDEIAAAAGVDPIEFRMRYMEDPRAKKALERRRNMRTGKRVLRRSGLPPMVTC